MKKEGKKTQVFTVWLRDDEVEEYDYLKRNGISVRHIFRTALHEAYSKETFAKVEGLASALMELADHINNWDPRTT